MPYLRLVEGDPSFHFPPISFEDNRSVVIEILNYTAVKKRPILCHEVKRRVPVWRRVLVRSWKKLQNRDYQWNSVTTGSMPFFSSSSIKLSYYQRLSSPEGERKTQNRKKRTNWRPSSLTGLPLLPNARILGQAMEKLKVFTPIALTRCMSCLYW